MIPALIPVAIKYGVPAAAFVVGHLVGWMRHKKAAKKAAGKVAVKTPAAS